MRFVLRGRRGCFHSTGQFALLTRIGGGGEEKKRKTHPRSEFQMKMSCCILSECCFFSPPTPSFLVMLPKRSTCTVIVFQKRTEAPAWFSTL